VPAIGFAAGIERLIIAASEVAPARVVDAIVCPLGERATTEAMLVARDLRAAGIAALADTRGGSLKSQLRRANDLGARAALVLGDTELDKGVVMLKDLAAHAQREIPRPEVVSALKQQLEGAR
jgi:histidyl-tRNA synthetase